MNEQTRSTFLAVSVGLIAGIGLLVGISATVGNAISPLMARGENLSEAQARLERKIEEMDKKLETIERKTAASRFGAGSDLLRPPTPQPEEDNTVYDIPVADSHVFGDPNAPVTIVEFSDLQCPFCSRFHTPLFEAAKAFSKDVKVIFKNFPLQMHPNARPAAKAALAAGLQGKYYEMVDVLLQNQNDLTEAKFVALAGQVGLDVNKFQKDLKDRDAEFEKKLNDDSELGSKINVQGTPTYFLNGKNTSARSPEAWKSAIEAALKGAKEEKK